MSDVILLTGGAGFIGSALGARLAAEGQTVVAVDNLHPQVHAMGEWPQHFPESGRRYTLDVTDPRTWDEVFAEWRPDVVVHLAAETGTSQSLRESSRHARVNVVGTSELLDGLTRVGHVPRKIVLTSSRAVYGEGRWADAEGLAYYPPGRSSSRLRSGLWTPEAPEGAIAPLRPLAHRSADTEPRPANVYAATKLAQEHVLSSWASGMGAELTVLRFQNVYGPGQSLANPYTGVVSLFGRLALEGQEIDVYEDGDIVRDFVYIDDVVSSVIAAIPGVGVPYALDIGSGAPTSILDVATIVARIAGGPAPRVSGRYRDGDIRAASADICDAQRVLGYAPQVSLEEGLTRLLASIERSQSATYATGG